MYKTVYIHHYVNWRYFHSWYDKPLQQTYNGVCLARDINHWSGWKKLWFLTGSWLYDGNCVVCTGTYNRPQMGIYIDVLMGVIGNDLEWPSIKGGISYWKPVSSMSISEILVRERSALATLIFTLRVCLSVILSFCHSVVLSVRIFGAKYLGNEAR